MDQSFPLREHIENKDDDCSAFICGWAHVKHFTHSLANQLNHWHLGLAVPTSQHACSYLGHSRQSSVSAECSPLQPVSHQWEGLNSEGPSCPVAGLVREGCGTPADMEETQKELTRRRQVTQFHVIKKEHCPHIPCLYTFILPSLYLLNYFVLSFFRSG